MYKVIVSVSIVVFLLTVACSDENDLQSLSIGDNFINPQTHISLMDTFSVKLSTVFIDSFPASSPENLLVGKYIDEYLGEFVSTPYFQLNIPEFEELDENAIFDSITLVLHYNGLSYGDTLKPQTINVQEVIEEIEETDELYIYNTSYFAYNEIPLGTKCFTPKPNRDKTLEIKLDNLLGNTLLEMMKDNSDELSASAEFLDFFKGVALVPGNDNAAVLEFESADSLVQFVLYTHLNDQTRTENKYTFSMYSASTCFNSVKSDRTDKLLENLFTQKIEIPASETDNKSFIQAGTGITTRVDFSELNRIMELDYRNILYKAELILKPLPLSDAQIEFPKEIMLYTTDKYNRLVSELLDENDDPVIAGFYFDEMYRENVYYYFDITEYLIDELSDAYFDPENGLIVSFPDETYKSTANRMVFDARSTESFRPILKLYFIFYN